MTQVAHVPIRTCLGCGGREPQRDLLRVVRAVDGTLQPQGCGGRGGYFHRRPDCWRQFARRKGMVRSWRAAVDRPGRAALVALLAARYGGE